MLFYPHMTWHHTVAVISSPSTYLCVMYTFVLFLFPFSFLHKLFSYFRLLLLFVSFYLPRIPTGLHKNSNWLLTWCMLDCHCCLCALRFLILVLIYIYIYMWVCECMACAKVHIGIIIIININMIVRVVTSDSYFPCYNWQVTDITLFTGTDMSRTCEKCSSTCILKKL